MKKFIRTLTLAAVITALGVCSFTAAAWAEPDDDVDIEIPGMEQLQEIVKEEKTEKKENTNSSSAKIDFNYSGKVDDRTGEHILGDGYREGKNFYILRSGELAYSSLDSRYHIICGDKNVYCNVPSGAVLTKGYSINISADEGIRYVMYLDGVQIEDQSQDTFKESGIYTLMIYNDEELSERRVEFRILDEIMGLSFQEYTLPPGFEFTEVTLDGNYKSRDYKDYYDFLEAGNYKLVWENIQIGQTYTTQFTMDITPPDLELPQVDEGAAREEITFRDLEAGEYVTWIRDYKEEGNITNANETLKDPGMYVVTVYDEAGNSTEYQFIIEGYLDYNAIIAILIVLASIAGVLIYSRRLRKHIRVG